MGPVRLFMGHPGPPRIAKNAYFCILWRIYEKLFSLVIHISALWWGLTALKFSFIWVRRKGPQDPPPPPKYEKKCFFSSYFGFKLKNFSSDFSLFDMYIDMGDRIAGKQDRAQSDHWRPPQGPLNSPKYIYFTFWLMYEKMVFKLFPLIVHMSPLWWGLHLLTFWCPWYPWILCKGPKWPLKKIKNNIFFVYFCIFKLKRFLSYCFFIWHVN